MFNSSSFLSRILIAQFHHRLSHPVRTPQGLRVLFLTLLHWTLPITGFITFIHLHIIIVQIVQITHFSITLDVFFLDFQLVSPFECYSITG